LNAFRKCHGNVEEAIKYAIEYYCKQSPELNEHLRTLKNMGFSNEKLNYKYLNRYNMNLEETIARLIEKGPTTSDKTESKQTDDDTVAVFEIIYSGERDKKDGFNAIQDQHEKNYHHGFKKDQIIGQANNLEEKVMSGTVEKVNVEQKIGEKFGSSKNALNVSSNSLGKKDDSCEIQYSPSKDGFLKSLQKTLQNAKATFKGKSSSSIKSHSVKENLSHHSKSSSSIIERVKNNEKNGSTHSLGIK
jgi:hypothetical protein